MANMELRRLMQDRAHAATRVLERRRISLEAAVEVLEVVGYRVYQDAEGRYEVEPPHDTPDRRDVFLEFNPSPETRNEFLAEYPTMLTVAQASEISGVDQGTMRKLCNEGKVPSMKNGGRFRIPKQFLLEPFTAKGDARE